MPATVPILMPVLVNQTFDYALAPVSGFDFGGEAVGPLAPGDFVVVPFGRQERIGVVWHRAVEPVDEHGEVRAKEIDPDKLKAVIEKLDVPPLPDVSMRFAEWVANYTLSPLGMVLKMMMSARQAFKAEAPRFGVRLSGSPPPARMTPAREKVLAVMEGAFVWAKGNLAAEADVSNAVINGLVKAGTLVEAELAPGKQPQPRANFSIPQFKDDQQEAAHRMRGLGKAAAFQTALLDGVTGSGKTEVYFEALAGALQGGRQVLVLLPEISLTNQFLDRFRERFGCRPATWHSAVSEGERGRLWRGVASGEVKAVIGAPA